MIIAGIAAESNPFHLGHRYHLTETRRITGADAVVVVMSGDFVQRGEPAMIDKYRRARMALSQGADVVLELPFSWATGTGERFADGMVEVLDRLGAVSVMAAGAEDSDDALRQELAQLLNEEPPEYILELRRLQKEGCSFPEARAAAADRLLPGAAGYLGSPNNILALEYQRAIRRRPDTALRLTTIPRLGEDYHSAAISPDTTASASGIRRALAESCEKTTELFSLPENVLRQIPEGCGEMLDYMITAEDMTPLLNQTLLTHTPEELARMQDMAPELAIRTHREFLRDPYRTFPQLAADVKPRQLTRTRINRALLHAAMGTELRTGPVPAVRILGFRRGTPAMRVLKDAAQIPLVTKMADAPEDYPREDILASRIYGQLVWQKYGIRLRDEVRQGPVIV